MCDNNDQLKSKYTNTCTLHSPSHSSHFSFLFFCLWQKSAQLSQPTRLSHARCNNKQAIDGEQARFKRDQKWFRSVWLFDQHDDLLFVIAKMCMFKARLMQSLTNSLELFEKSSITFSRGVAWKRLLIKLLVTTCEWNSIAFFCALSDFF